MKGFVAKSSVFFVILLFFHKFVDLKKEKEKIRELVLDRPNKIII